MTAAPYRDDEHALHGVRIEALENRIESQVARIDLRIDKIGRAHWLDKLLAKIPASIGVGMVSYWGGTTVYSTFQPTSLVVSIGMAFLAFGVMWALERAR